MQPTTQAALTAWEVSLYAMRDSLGHLLRQVESEVWDVPGPADHVQQVLRDDITRLNGLLAEKDYAIRGIQRLYEEQGQRVIALTQRVKNAEAEVERLATEITEKDAEITRCRGVIVAKSEEMGDIMREGEARRVGLLAAKIDMERLSTLLDEKEREIEQLAQAEDALRQARRDARDEVDRLTQALRQSNYQRDNAVADKTIAQAVAAKAWEETKALRQQVEELRRHVRIG